MEKIVRILYLSKRNHQQCSKKGLLLHCADTEVQELFETLQDPGPPADAGEDNADEYKKALQTLDAYFSTQLNEPYERHVFINLKHEEGETVDQFITRLRRHAEIVIDEFMLKGVLWVIRARLQRNKAAKYTFIFIFPF